MLEVPNIREIRLWSFKKIVVEGLQDDKAAM